MVCPEPFEVPAEVPVGGIVPYAGPINPWTGARLEELGWLVCDGRAVFASRYPELFAVIGTLHGQPPNAGAGVFCLPDLRGVFVRGLARGLTNDPGPRTSANPNGTGNEGDQVGSREADAFQAHEHQYREVSPLAKPTLGPGDAPNAGVQNANTSAVEPDGGDAPRASSETRPLNVALNFVIRCRSRVPRAAQRPGWVGKRKDSW